MQHPKRIGILGTMDTRGDEVAFLKRTIEDMGHRAVVIDLGVLGTPYEAGEINREEVARAVERYKSFSGPPRQVPIVAMQHA